MSLINMYWAYCQAVVRTRIKDERGASLVEYALLLALIAVVCIAAIRFIGTRANNSFNSTGSAL
ncbi:MAG: Flp family type IVb pilin [Actinomycetota bacterium]|nr:Flp family type IVb pilin [Actinomycetota bacterium]